MNFETIDFQIEDGVARLSFNRPERLNSFNTTMHREVRMALDHLQDSELPAACC
ncbi:MAG: hypothetical protein R3E95_24555 [Thiolinea sp.]